MEINILEWIGYLASILVAISLMLTSIVRLRIVNLIGSGTFAVYGFLIGSLPVGFMNLFIVFVNIYYLYLLLNRKEYFETLEVSPENKYLARYLKFHENEIERYFPGFIFDSQKHSFCFFILRDAQVAGLFIAYPENDHTLHVVLDYVGPRYRDLKNGYYIYNKFVNFFKEQNFNKIIAEARSKHHYKYLQRLNFKPLPDQGEQEILFEKGI
ncbi:GNAT family N-acetyltransferase [Salinivirga cyanobacteriivorans]